jgi:hypothetical protein
MRKPSRGSAVVDSRGMEIQVPGIRKSSDTRKAPHFFAERRIKMHVVDPGGAR